MRSCKRLKNINSVSGKLGERHIDPYLTLTKVRFVDSGITRRQLVNPLPRPSRRIALHAHAQSRPCGATDLGTAFSWRRACVPTRECLKASSSVDQRCFADAARARDLKGATFKRTVNSFT